MDKTGRLGLRLNNYAMRDYGDEASKFGALVIDHDGNF